MVFFFGTRTKTTTKTYIYIINGPLNFHVSNRQLEPFPLLAYHHLCIRQSQLLASQLSNCDGSIMQSTHHLLYGGGVTMSHQSPSFCRKVV